MADQSTVGGGDYSTDGSADLSSLLDPGPVPDTTAAPPVSAAPSGGGSTSGGSASGGSSGGGSSSSSGGGAAPAADTTASTPSIDPQQAAANFGFAYAFMTSDPELKALFDTAVAQGWDANRFTAGLRNTQWYQNRSESVRKSTMEEKSDPATFKANVAKMQAQVRQSWTDMFGASSIDDNQINQWADMAYRQGLSPDQLLQTMFSTVSDHIPALMESKQLGGGAQAALGHVEQLLGDYGVSMTNDTRDRMAADIVFKRNSNEGAQQRIKDLAKSTYTQFGAQLDAGQTMRQIADPYVAKMGDLLEQSHEGISLMDPLLQRALTYKDPKTGQQTALSVSDFANQVRQDNRWQYTQNAKDTAASTIRTLGQAFGVAQ